MQRGGRGRFGRLARQRNEQARPPCTLLLLGLALCALPIASPSPSPALEQIGVFPFAGRARAVERVGDRAYVLSGSTNATNPPSTVLTILDVSVPSAPLELGSMTLCCGSDLAVVDGRAYVAGAGLRILDVTIPSAPVEIGFLPGVASSVEVVDDVAYVAAATDGLLIVDVSAPASPTVLQRLDSSDPLETASAIRVDGDLTYIASGNLGGPGGSLRIVDISDPASAHVVGEDSLSGYVSALDVANSYAYVSESTTLLSVFDVSNPALPVQVASVQQSTYVEQVQVVGNRLYMAGMWSGVAVFDISDPSDPVEVSGIEVLDPSGGALDLVLAGDVLLVASLAVNNSGALVGIDATDPSIPALVGGYQPLLGDRILVENNLLYAFGDGPSIGVYDLVDPASAVFLGGVPVAEPVLGADVSGGILFAAMGEAGLASFDFRDPANPLPLHTFDTVGYASDVTVLGGVAFVADGEEGLLAIDVSAPSSPSLLGGSDTPGNALRVEIRATHAFVADAAGGLRIIDVSDPSMPTELGFLDDLDDARELHVASNLAYVVDYPDEIVVVDVADPATPSRLGAALLPDGDPRAIDVHGAWLYLADGLRSARLFDVSDPSMPVDVVGYDPRAPALSDVVVEGPFAYFSGPGGLRVIDFGVSGGVPVPSLSLPATLLLLVPATAFLGARRPHRRSRPSRNDAPR